MTGITGRYQHLFKILAEQHTGAETHDDGQINGSALYNLRHICLHAVESGRKEYAEDQEKQRDGSIHEDSGVGYLTCFPVISLSQISWDQCTDADSDAHTDGINDLLDGKSQ